MWQGFVRVSADGFWTKDESCKKGLGDYGTGFRVSRLGIDGLPVLGCFSVGELGLQLGGVLVPQVSDLLNLISTRSMWHRAIQNILL